MNDPYPVQFSVDYIGWGGAFLWTPDLATVTLVLGALLFAVALVRLVWLWRVPRLVGRTP